MPDEKTTKLQSKENNEPLHRGEIEGGPSHLDYSFLYKNVTIKRSSDKFIINDKIFDDIKAARTFVDSMNTETPATQNNPIEESVDNTEKKPSTLLDDIFIATVALAALLFVHAVVFQGMDPKNAFASVLRMWQYILGSGAAYAVFRRFF